MKRYLLFVFFVSSFSCGEAQEGMDKSELTKRFPPVTTLHVTEPIKYTDKAYTFTGKDSIESIYSLFPGADADRVWFGFDSNTNYSVDSTGGVCDGRGTLIAKLAELPKTIEGVITLHPRYYQKIKFCDQGEKFYGSYLLQDSTRGILVLKDSRIADFIVGDRVKLRVRGLVKYFDTYAVLVHDEEEVIEHDNEVYFEDIGFRSLTNADIGFNLRITGRVAGLPNTRNFNELCLVAADAVDDAACSESCKNDEACGGNLLVSLDREIGQRQSDFFKIGDVMQVTGPAVNSYGYNLLVAQMGQLKIIKSNQN